MAVYRFSLATISRGAGRSAVAAAAYRSAARLLDQRTQQTHDFRRKAGVLATALLGWNGTREALWNDAETAERRKDAVTAREIQLALPHELPRTARWGLALGMATWLRARYGVAVDVAMHAPGTMGDTRNHHAHLLLTTRAVTGDEFGAKTRVLDVRRTGSVELETMRAEWAAQVNGALAGAGLRVQVDHRSYARQGLPRESEHLTRGARAVEARGEGTDRGDAVRAARVRNRRRHVSGAETPARDPGPLPSVVRVVRRGR
jgi:hypothetical protein